MLIIKIVKKTLKYMVKFHWKIPEITKILVIWNMAYIVPKHNFKQTGGNRYESRKMVVELCSAFSAITKKQQ